MEFDRKFCEDAINEILLNTYVSDEPPRFDDINLAESFLLDGLKIACSDNDLNSEELKFLSLTVDLNNVDPVWFNEKVDEFQKIEIDTSDLTDLNLRGYLKKIESIED